MPPFANSTTWRQTTTPWSKTSTTSARGCHNLRREIQLNRPASPKLSARNELAASRLLIVIALPSNNVTASHFVVRVAAEIEYPKPVKLTQYILTSLRSFVCLIILLISLLSYELSAAGAERVKLVRTPDDGLQPQAAVDRQGVIHLIYFKGDD